MTVHYYEDGPDRVLAVMDAVDDVSPFLQVGKQPVSKREGGGITAARGGRFDEYIRVFIRPVTPGALADGKFSGNTQVGGNWAVAAGITNPKHVADRQRITLLTDTAVGIEAGFELMFKRYAHQEDAEAHCVCEYHLDEYQGDPAISDESDMAAGVGFFAIRLSALAATVLPGQLFAVEIVLDDPSH